MLNDLKALIDAPKNIPGLVSFYGAYHVPESGQICIVLDYVDGGSLADVLAKVRSTAAMRPKRMQHFQAHAMMTLLHACCCCTALTQPVRGPICPHVARSARSPSECSARSLARSFTPLRTCTATSTWCVDTPGPREGGPCVGTLGALHAMRGLPPQQGDACGLHCMEGEAE